MRSSLILGALFLIAGHAPGSAQSAEPGPYRNPIIFARSEFNEATGDAVRWGKIWMMEEDGSRLRQLTSGSNYDDHPALFSDSRHALYSQFRADHFDPQQGARLMRIDIYTGEEEVFAEEVGCALHHVTLSVPEDLPVYQRECGERRAQWVGIGAGSYEVNMWAANGVAVGDSLVFMHEKNPFLAPRQVALVRFYGCGRGSRAVFLTDDHHLNRRPAVSPDHEWLAWQSNAGGGEDEVLLARIDGSDTRNLTRSPGLDGHPWFSRDGQWIVFESNRTGTQEIWKIHLETLLPVQLTFGGTKYSSRTPRW